MSKEVNKTVAITDLKKMLYETLHPHFELDNLQHNDRHGHLCLKCEYTDWNIAVRKLLGLIEKL